MRKAIVRGFLFSFSLATIVILFIFNQFEFLDWHLLWFESFSGLPFIVVLIIVTLFFGGLIGFIPYRLQQKEIAIVKEALEHILTDQSEGKVRYYGQVKETEQVIRLIADVQQQLNQVTKRMQELMTERIEDQEEQIEARLTEERNRLARELHDSVSQELFAASMLVSAINEMSFNELDQLTQPLT